jgi:hypothetical protein
MRIIRRSYFTLLETLIAVAWTIVIVTTLSYFYREIDAFSNQTELLQKESFKMRYVENRLSEILPKAVSATDSKKDFYFFTSNDPSLGFLHNNPANLVFTFDNGVDLNKLFSNHVLGRIYVDAQKRLSLSTWPSPQRWADGAMPPMHNEILLDEVDALKFSFFVAPDKWKNQPKDESEEEPKKKNPTPKLKPDREGSWVSEWSNEYQLLPALIRIEVQRKGKVEQFVFPLSKTQRQIVYNQ